MNHLTAVEIMEAADRRIAGGLSTRQTVESHLANCPDCRANVEGEVRLLRALSSTVPVPVSPTVVGRSVAEIRREIFFHRTLEIVRPIAAVLVPATLVFAVFLLIPTSGPSNTSGTETIAGFLSNAANQILQQTGLDSLPSPESIVARMWTTVPVTQWTGFAGILAAMAVLWVVDRIYRRRAAFSPK